MNSDNIQTNKLGQPIGQALDNWQACERPSRTVMMGQYCRLEPVSELHTEDLFAAFGEDRTGYNWTYLPYGPFDRVDEFAVWLQEICRSDDPLFYTVVDNRSDKAVGLASYLRIEPATGVIEVGHIHFSPLMQGTALATEAMYLMMKRAFDELGYRRYEWKCDVLNAPSKKAAQRLGFIYEGLFRQATMYKQRNRDTAWFSILDQEWPALKSAFDSWLAPENFDDHGKQLQKLEQCMARVQGESS